MTNDEDGEGSDYPGAPWWVRVFGIIGLVLAVAFVVLHLMGGGFGRHLHG